MKLDDFLKTQKVRCVKAYGDCLTVGKEYSVLNIRMEVEVRDDEGGKYYWESDHFEPVVDDELLKSAENPLQNIELTPEFEAVEPKFKVGDKVYFPNMAGGEILTLLDNKACHYPFFVNVVNAVNNSLYELDSNGKTKYGNFTDFAVKATPENYEMLCKLYPHIEFEQPPKPLTGSDLARAMLDKGWKYVPCYISDSSDTHALERQTRNTAVIIGTHKDHPSFFIYGSGKSFIYYAVPFDPRTGALLTESILND